MTSPPGGRAIGVRSWIGYLALAWLAASTLAWGAATLQPVEAPPIRQRTTLPGIVVWVESSVDHGRFWGQAWDSDVQTTHPPAGKTWLRIRAFAVNSTNATIAVPPESEPVVQGLTCLESWTDNDGGELVPGVVLAASQSYDLEQDQSDLSLVWNLGNSRLAKFAIPLP